MGSKPIKSLFQKAVFSAVIILQVALLNIKLVAGLSLLLTIHKLNIKCFHKQIMLMPLKSGELPPSFIYTACLYLFCTLQQFKVITNSCY